MRRIQCEVGKFQAKFYSYCLHLFYLLTLLRLMTSDSQLLDSDDTIQSKYLANFSVSCWLFFFFFSFLTLKYRYYASK